MAGQNGRRDILSHGKTLEDWILAGLGDIVGWEVCRRVFVIKMPAHFVVEIMSCREVIYG